VKFSSESRTAVEKVPISFVKTVAVQVVFDKIAKSDLMKDLIFFSAFNIEQLSTKVESAGVSDKIPCIFPMFYGKWRYLLI
jgi:hypothetical protein